MEFTKYSARNFTNSAKAKQIALKLKALRQEKNISIAELSEATGIHQSVILSYEYNRIKFPNPDKVKQLFEYFGVEYGG